MGCMAWPQACLDDREKEKKTHKNFCNGKKNH